MRVFTIILLTFAAIALVVLLATSISLLRWRTIKDVRNSYIKPFLVSLIVFIITIIGSLITFNLDVTQTHSATPAIEIKKSKLPGTKVQEKSSSENQKNKSPMINTFSNAKAYPYNELISSDKLANKPFTINQAQVIQVGNNKGKFFALAFDTEAKENIYLIVFEHDPQAKVNDLLNVSGVIGKRTTYKTSDGQSKTVPTIFAFQNVVTGHHNPVN